MRYVTAPVPVEAWQRIDGCVDNSMSLDAVDGITETLLAGACVRDAGWRAAASHRGERDEHGWPRHGAHLNVTLRAEHWEWVVTQLRRWGLAPADSDTVELIAAALAR